MDILIHYNGEDESARGFASNRLPLLDLHLSCLETGLGLKSTESLLKMAICTSFSLYAQDIASISTDLANRPLLQARP